MWFATKDVRQQLRPLVWRTATQSESPLFPLFFHAVEQFHVEIALVERKGNRVERFSQWMPVKHFKMKIF